MRFVCDLSLTSLQPQATTVYSSDEFSSRKNFAIYGEASLNFTLDKNFTKKFYGNKLHKEKVKIFSQKLGQANLHLRVIFVRGLLSFKTFVAKTLLRLKNQLCLKNDIESSFF